MKLLFGLVFTFLFTESFSIQDEITIIEGADLYLHLNVALSGPHTCKLYGPDKNEYTNFRVDPIFPSSCGYIVHRVNQDHSGTWTIEYVDVNNTHRQSFDVTVLDTANFISIDSQHWSTGDSIDMFLGPKNAVYCIIEDSNGRRQFDSFGNCRITINRVSIDHKGTWKAFLGLPGTILLQEYKFNVYVDTIDDKSVVTTAISRNAPSVMLTCSVPNTHMIHSCKFRDPSGNIMVAVHGVGENGYVMYNSSANYDSDANSHDCTLRLTNPSISDLGIWRCAIDTNTGTYYGFLTVVCPHLMQDPEVAAAVVTEPILSSVTTNLTHLEDEPVVMRCSIPSALRYCYFRARNGSVYNVFPSMSSSESFQYVGAGLDAGECGIRFSSLAVADSGRWSCHVGLVDGNLEEQRIDMNVNITAKITVRHYWRRSHQLVEAIVYHQHPIEYCRFVRVNGQGFTSENVPSRYRILDGMQKGRCLLEITNPDLIDSHPWTIAVKLIGIKGELSARTRDNILFFAMPTMPGDILFWCLIISMCLVPLALAAILIPNKNRRRASVRAGIIRESIRNSWNKTFKKNQNQSQEQRA